MESGCHVLLGEVEDAIQGFEKSMDSSNVVCLDRQVVMSASDGIQKSQKHEEAITLCQQTVDFAEKNFTIKPPGNLDVEISCVNVRQWRHRILSKCPLDLYLILWNA
uniref:Uncharacterized protein n=2 Tax=Opuntia streptacantha TaxID=393608 RepID=A0A7C9D1T0_OPUST